VTCSCRPFVIAGNQPSTDDRAGDSLLSQLQLHPSALELVQHGAERLLGAQLEWKFGQSLRQWLARVVSQTGDLSASLVFDRERLEHVVHFRSFEIQTRGFARSELSSALEIADPVFVEHNLPDRQIGRNRRGGGEHRGHESGSGPHHILSLTQPPIARHTLKDIQFYVWPRPALFPYWRE